MTRRRSPDLKAVIMAGGSGTRFWPLSRKRRPKQFLPIVGSRTMLEETVVRVCPLIPAAKTFTIANAVQTRTIGRLLPRLPKDNLIIEPRARNTAPSLLLATARIYLENPKAVIAVLPSDHLISDNAAFLKSSPRLPRRRIGRGIWSRLEFRRRSLRPATATSISTGKGRRGSSARSFTRSSRSGKSRTPRPPSDSCGAATIIGIRACSSGGRTRSPTP